MIRLTSFFLLLVWCPSLLAAPPHKLPSRSVGQSRGKSIGSDEILERLYKVRKELKKQSLLLAEAESKSATLKAAIRKNSAEADALASELTQIKAQIVKNRLELDSTSIELKSSKLKLKKLLNSNRERFKQIFYQTVSMQAMSELGIKAPVAVDFASLDRKAKYLFLLKKASAHDRLLVDQMERARDDYLARLGELKTLSAKARSLLTKAEKSKQLIESKNESLIELRSLNSAQKRKLKDVLSAIKGQEAKLQSILYSIIKNLEQQESKGVVQRRKLPANSKKSDGEQLVKKYDGTGLVGLSNRASDKAADGVQYPVKAPLLASKRKRGKKTEAWGNILRFKGEQNGVYAISSGMVRFKGNLGSYQKDSIVVILDHGKRQYSVYGGMNVAAVKAGDKIRAGELIGYLPIVDGSFELLFDLRFSGKSMPIGKFLPKYR